MISNAMQTMSNSLHGLIVNITEGIGVLSSSSAELSTNSAQMTESSQESPALPTLWLRPQSR